MIILQSKLTINTLVIWCVSCSKLVQEGLTHHDISERVKEKSITESESIYGTLYGTLEEEM